MIKKFTSCLLLTLISFVLMLSYSNAKYYSKTIAQIWETNFAAFNVVDPGSEKLYFSIGGQSSDNENSIFDNKAILNYNSTNDRWTNWLGSGTNKGEKVTIAITFVSPVTISTMRIYYFVDHQGCDLPRAIDLSYVDYYTQETIVVHNGDSIENIDKNFEPTTDYVYTTAIDPWDTVFREKPSSGTPLFPVYYMDSNGDGTQENVDVTKSSSNDAPYSQVYFDRDSNGNVNRVTTNQLTLVMHTASDWYMGLTELAIDWTFIYDEFKEQLGDSYWYGRI